VKSAYLKVGLPQQKIYTIKIASLTIMGWKDTGRLMISVTFYLYANSVTVNYTVRVLLMAKLLPLLEGVLIVFLPVLPISEAVVTHQIAFWRKIGRSVRYFPIPSKKF
jgi:hypothetical protein